MIACLENSLQKFEVGEKEREIARERERKRERVRLLKTDSRILFKQVGSVFN